MSATFVQDDVTKAVHSKPVVIRFDERVNVLEVKELVNVELGLGLQIVLEEWNSDARSFGFQFRNLGSRVLKQTSNENPQSHTPD
jgi:hypothetical protein